MMFDKILACFSFYKKSLINGSAVYASYFVQSRMIIGFVECFLKPIIHDELPPVTFLPLISIQHTIDLQIAGLSLSFASRDVRTITGSLFLVVNIKPFYSKLLANKKHRSIPVF